MTKLTPHSMSRWAWINNRRPKFVQIKKDDRWITVPVKVQD